jgi:hypothetical protein
METTLETAVANDAWYMNLSVREADNIAEQFGLTLFDVLSDRVV